MAYGRTSLPNNAVYPTRVSADGSPEYKAGGITIDWSLVSAVSGADVTLTDGSIIKIGQKYLRYGQVMTKVTASGLFGPYDPDLTQGSELLVRGNCFILDQTILQYPSGASTLGPSIDQCGEAIEGGKVWIDRILNTGTSTHTKAGGPTLAEVLAVFPNIYPVRD